MNKQRLGEIRMVVNTGVSIVPSWAKELLEEIDNLIEWRRMAIVVHPDLECDVYRVERYIDCMEEV
jgi:hypothetical protein